MDRAATLKRLFGQGVVSKHGIQGSGGPYIQTPLRVVALKLMVVEETQFSQSENPKDLGPMEDQEGVPWEESCLMNFSKCMGMSIEGFEDEFLELMNKVSDRRQKGKGKGAHNSTKFARELKKLEWNVKEKGRIRVGASGNKARGLSMGL